MPGSVIEVDLDAIDHNTRLLTRVLGPSSALCAIIKADAYALGAPRIAKRIAGAGASMLGVYALDEARALVQHAIRLPILVLGPVRTIRRDDRLFRFAATGDLHLSAHAPDQLEDLGALADAQGVTLPVHVELDTGMARGGASCEQASAMLERIHTHRRLRCAGLFTHYACAESDAHRTDEQRRAFDVFIDAHAGLLAPDCLLHGANTHALFRGRETHRSMARVGLGLFGYADRANVAGDFALEREARGLRPVFRWSSEIVHLRTVPPGTSVGYGSLWTARRTSRIGVVPVGYADGYPANLGNRARVGVVLERRGGQALRAFAPVVGAVSMDQIVVDLTDVPEACLATRVELISDDPTAPNALPQLARLAETVPYDLMCRLHPRLERRYEMPGVRTRLAVPGPARGSGDLAAAG